MNDIMVSILCITYNHESYIRDAIEGFLMQKTNFKYEIIIHDDASIDNTAEIIKEYEQKYPGLIYGIYESQNQWSYHHPALDWIIELQKQHCKGKYIASCEGDDYWIDMQKLQLQVDYMEKHPECMMSIHDGLDVDCRNNTIRSKSLYAKDCVIRPEEIITQRHVKVPSASMLYRRDMLGIKNFFLQSGIGDYPCLLYCIEKGTIYYFSRIMSVYRYYHKDSWSETISQDMVARVIQLVLTIDFLRKYNQYSEKKYEYCIKAKIQICVDDAINTLGKQSLDNVLEICRECDEKTEKKYHNIFKELERIWQQKYDENYLDEALIDFISNQERIFIMGAGCYASIVARQLISKKIDFEGFVVSDDQQTIEVYLEKPVYKLKEIQSVVDNIGIIIGINPIIWDQIMCSLENVEPKNYICPFLLNEGED